MGIPVEISKNECDNVFDSIIQENHSVIIKTIHGLSVEHDCKFVFRRCFSSFPNKTVLIKHKESCKQQEISNKTSNESHLFWKKHFHKNS